VVSEESWKYKNILRLLGDKLHLYHTTLLINKLYFTKCNISIAAVVNSANVFNENGFICKLLLIMILVL
jgi:hypothetical protein